MTVTSDFGTFGRYVETPIVPMSPDIKAADDFTKMGRGMVPGPQEILLANPRLSRMIVSNGAYNLTGSTVPNSEVEIVTNLINGKWRAVYANYEHEIVAETAGGLAPQKVQALIAGLPTSFDDPPADRL